MKRLIFALAALMAATHVASAKTWADPGCAYLLATSDEWSGWRYATSDGIDTLCHVESWPISSPVAKMACDNGIKTEMVSLGNGRIEFNMIVMEEVTPDNDVCHRNH